MSLPLAQLYQETLTILKVINEECKKSSGVKLNMMLEKYAECEEQLKHMLLLEANPLRADGLVQLQQMLKSQQAIVTAKFAQLQKELHQLDASPVKDQKGEAKSPSVADEAAGSRDLAISGTIVPKTGLTFDEVAGLEEAKQALKEAIVLPLKFPQLFVGRCKPWQRILMYGPPGTGKSRLAQAVSAEINSTFYSVSSSDLLSSWVGESEKIIRDLFQHAINQDNKSVVFIDEIDSLCRKRHSGEQEYTRRIKTELLKQMEGVNADSRHEQMFILCATNCPWDLDSAFLRRFQKMIYTPLPDTAARLKLMQIHTQGHPGLQILPDQWQNLADITQDFSGSDLSTLVTNALYEPIRQMQTAQLWNVRLDGKFRPCEKHTAGAFTASLTSLPPGNVAAREVTVDDFYKALKNSKKTVSATELQRFTDFANSFDQS